MKCVVYQPASQPTTRLSWKIGAKISWILVQKWPRKMTKVGWTPKSALKHFFSSKIPQDFELLEQVPESSRQTSNFGRNQYIGTYILSQSALPRIVSPIQPRRAQYSPLLHSSAQYSPVQLSTAQYSLLQPTTAQYSAVQPSTAQCSQVQHGNPYHPGHFGQPLESPRSPWSVVTLVR